MKIGLLVVEGFCWISFDTFFTYTKQISLIWWLCLKDVVSDFLFIFKQKKNALDSSLYLLEWRENQITLFVLHLATEVNVARSRLKGALQEIEGNQNDDDELDTSKPSRGRPPKRVKKELSPQPQQTVHHTFIMKLFDRSVDLGKYTQDTALYPICRAWMLNQPRSNSIVK